jgi:hypothetical protein
MANLLNNGTLKNATKNADMKTARGFWLLESMFCQVTNAMFPTAVISLDVLQYTNGLKSLCIFYPALVTSEDCTGPSTFQDGQVLDFGLVDLRGVKL